MSPASRPYLGYSAGTSDHLQKDLPEPGLKGDIIGGA
jgi:hypothetical protein